MTTMKTIPTGTMSRVARLTAIADQRYGGIVPPAVQNLIREHEKNRLTPVRFFQALNQPGSPATPDTIIKAMWRGRTPRHYKPSAPEVKTVTRYQVEGYHYLFESQAEAEKFSLQVTVAKQIESLLIPRSVIPQESNIESNNKVYIQQNAFVIKKCVKLLRAAIIEFCGSEYFGRYQDRFDNNPSYAAQMLDGPSKWRPLYEVAYRLACTDDKFREWNHKYWMYNPNPDAVAINLNR